MTDPIVIEPVEHFAYHSPSSVVRESKVVDLSSPSNDVNGGTIRDPESMVTSKIVEEAIARDVPNALMAIDVSQLTRQAEKWASMFPHIKPFYAVKSLPDAMVLSTLASCGVNYDCASRAEIDAVLGAGVEPDRIIFANPCKFPRDIAHAKSHGIKKMTFDNDDELEKIAEIFPSAELVLRIVTDDSASVCRLSNKYGAAIEDCPFLLERANQLNLNIIGVSFHVGSGASNANAFVDSLTNARKVFDMGVEAGFEKFRFLDIGGGFPGDDDGAITLAQIADVVNPAISGLFPDDTVEVIAEPGRFFSHSVATLAARVIGRRVVPTNSKAPEDPDVLYYIGDGIYGSFNCMLYDHYVPSPPMPVSAEGGDLSEPEICRVFGPTCDGLDTLYDSIHLPRLGIGDWLVFKNMGAYTICAASHFNGLDKAQIMYFRTKVV